MVKKGRFKILSYRVEDNLIFYQSLNKNEKVIAFSIFEFKQITQIINLLNDFLKNRFLSNFSIQLNIQDKEKALILMCIIDSKKANIIKIFNLIKKTLEETHNSIFFLKNDPLEKEFLEIIIEKTDSNIKIWRKKDSLMVNYENNARTLDFYELNLSNIVDRTSIFNILLNLINNYNKIGYLILSFRFNNMQGVLLSAYFIDVKKQKCTDEFDIEKEVNNFFNYPLLSKHNVNLNEVHNYLWRLHITNNHYISDHLLELFIDENKPEVDENFTIKMQLENELNLKGISFCWLNQNLILIEQRILFLILNKLDFNFLFRICKNYYSKYIIYLLILNDTDHNRALTIDKLQNLKELKILSRKEFEKFDFTNLKEHLLLENS